MESKEAFIQVCACRFQDAHRDLYTCVFQHRYTLTRHLSESVHTADDHFRDMLLYQ